MEMGGEDGIRGRLLWLDGRRKVCEGLYGFGERRGAENDRGGTRVALREKVRWSGKKRRSSCVGLAQGA